MARLLWPRSMAVERRRKEIRRIGLMGAYDDAGAGSEADTDRCRRRNAGAPRVAPALMGGKISSTTCRRPGDHQNGDPLAVAAAPAYVRFGARDALIHFIDNGTLAEAAIGGRDMNRQLPGDLIDPHPLAGGAPVVVGDDGDRLGTVGEDPGCAFGGQGENDGCAHDRFMGFIFDADYRLVNDVLAGVVGGAFAFENNDIQRRRNLRAGRASKELEN